MNLYSIEIENTSNTTASYDRIRNINMVGTDMIDALKKVNDKKLLEVSDVILSITLENRDIVI